MRSIFNETLDNTKLLNDFSNHTEQFTQQIEKNQFMQSCLDTFQLKFDNNVVEEVKQPKTFHLLELLEQSINSKEDAIK
ncbi:MAG: hypothetical protein LBH96_05000 [Candidatus Peribacteria bacterium]|jgi:hypothetical protein|nr:hypothetical protein [Candidatus Peribacteria bacterium]